jgi:hypothetical protein
LRYELGARLDWVVIPLRGLIAMVRGSESGGEHSIEETPWNG